METSIHKRRRIFLHFFLGIGLPSLLLGYLAFRGIQNDKALLEKERRNEHRAIAQQIAQSIDENISKVEQAFLDSIANSQGLHHSAILRSLDSLKSQHALVEEVFFFAGSEQLQLPTARLLFLADGSAHPLAARARPSSLSREVQSSQQYEFQQRDYQTALAGYRQAFTHVSDHEVKGALPPGGCGSAAAMTRARWRRGAIR